MAHALVAGPTGPATLVAMRMPLVASMALAALASACGDICNPVIGCTDAWYPLPKSGEMHPVSFPYTMSVGDTLRFDATFYDKFEATGYAKWETSDPAVCGWRAPDPPCPKDRCSILEARSPGTVTVSAFVCLGDTPGCGGTIARITVQP